MSIDLHIPSTESQRERIKIEEESKFVPSQFDQSAPVDNVHRGFELAKERVISYLTERADWLRMEYVNGGAEAYLIPKEEDCRYIAKVVKEMKP